MNLVRPLCLLLVVASTATGPRIVAAESPASVARDHWAFAPLRPTLPSGTKAGDSPSATLDRFIQRELVAQRLKPAPTATRAELLRRVSFGLIGLPPTPEELDAFERDRSPDAWTKVVDRLLASPHYGERWARHWLDLARYAESDGFEHDAPRPHAWRYRDYVVASFNADKPYDRFLQEQIAGDLLWPDRAEALVATSFNLLGPDMVDSADQVQRRFNTLNDLTDTTAAVVLGLTFGCARCHDHKFEPITQVDYFRFQAFFTPAEFRRDQDIATEPERAVHRTAKARYQGLAGETERALKELEAPYRRALYDGKFARLSEDAQLAHRTPREKRTKEQEGTVQETALQIEVTDAEVRQRLSAENRSRQQALLAQRDRLPKPPSLPMTMALHETNGPAPATFVLARGDYNQPRDAVTPGFPAVLSQSHPTGDRRDALARWLTSPDNPLTARVLVNRIWQHHFGRGLVETPGDFGTRGARPTHPELLDWLAGEFIRQGWSLKALHRTILLSASYRQTSVASAAVLERDPGNRLFSRQNRVRLEGEAVRDSLLAISGRLNPALGGPSVFPPIPEDITRTSKNWTASTNVADQCRRSLYIFARRNLRFPFLEAFDAPDNNLTCPERGRSTTAPQALALLNADEVQTAARGTAQRLRIASLRNDDARIEAACQLILGRQPTETERRYARAFLLETRQRAKSVGSSDNDGLAELCRGLFNLNSFLYVD